MADISTSRTKALPTWLTRLDEFRSGLGSEVDFHTSFLVDMAAEYGTGDPRQWSGRLVERVLTDLAPRKLAADKESLLDLPRTLRALVRYSHHLLGVPPAISGNTLEAIRVFEPDYRALVEAGGTGILGAMKDMGFDFEALRGALESGNTDAADEIFGQFVADYNRAIAEDEDEDEDNFGRTFCDFLIAAAGGEEALSGVTAETTLAAVKAAKKYGTVVSYDLNFRPSTLGGAGR